MTVLCFDPGVTTGMSVMHNGHDILDYTSKPWSVVMGTEFPQWSMVRHFIHRFQPHIILYETFHCVTLKADFTPLEVIGAIKATAQYCGYNLDKQLIARTPHSRMFATRRYGEPELPSIHARAATNHIVSWLYTEHNVREFVR